MALEGRVVIVTGAGRGIGAATASLLADAGARVVLASRTAGEIDAVAAEIAARAGADRVLAVPTDLADEQAIVRLVAATLSHFGDLHALVNNGATFRAAPAEELTAADWDAVMDVNARGTFLASREALRAFRRLGHGGAIVNLSSLGGLRGTPKFAGFTAYSVSKFAVVGLTECLAVEGRPLGVRVNCVAPGAVETRMLREAAPFLRTETSPAQVARTIRFLCDDEESGAVTGAVLEIHSNL
ncbi:MAG: SDR family oxidoreductase [bacterium]|nr:SDR family oxidoreductase [bacterium]